MAKPDHKRLGELLVQNGSITEEQLQQALTEQAENGGKIGQVLVSLEFIAEHMMLAALAEQIGVPFIDLTHHNFDKTLVSLLPANYARRFRAIILGKDQENVIVGMANPLDLLAYDELVHVIKQPISLVLVQESKVLTMIDMLYRRTDEISGFAQDLTEELTDAEKNSTEEEPTSTSSVPVVKLLQTLLEDALQVQASDVHIEPDEHVLRIRHRVDGILHEQIINEKQIASALTLRLKLMGGLNIAERRLPQDGRFNFKFKDRRVDVRLSTMPVEHGESVVLRLLDQAAVSLDLTKSGMSDGMLARFRRNIKRPYGMVLVTGPTGSGKTTTLYSALSELNSADKKIITVEDPVEYRMERISQVQINEKIDLDFARVLRTALRQDPDIILVGEVRDQETASIAIRAALTGHLVLASLHTNDATSSVTRLMDMGMEGYLIATALRTVLAQRLVRRICESCREECQITDNERNWAIKVGGKHYKDTPFYHGKGCAYCNNSGFHGRTGVFELFELNSKVIDALSNNDPNAFNLAIESHQKKHSLSLSALETAKSGETTISEALRIAGEFDDDYEGSGAEQIDLDKLTDIVLEDNSEINSTASSSAEQDSQTATDEPQQPFKLSLKRDDE